MKLKNLKLKDEIDIDETERKPMNTIDTDRLRLFFYSTQDDLLKRKNDT